MIMYKFMACLKMRLRMLSIVVILFEFSYSMDKCRKDDEMCSEEIHNLYKEDHSVFINARKKAINNFNPKEISCYNSTILDELRPFKNGITKKMLESSYGKGVKYQLIDHQLYRSPDCLFPSRCAGIEYFIKNLRAELPDFECIINVYDWPQVSRHQGFHLPVFSFSKTGDYLDIMYPAWSFWEGGPAIKIYPKGLGRWDLHRKQLLAVAKEWPWNKKEKIFFFRGSRTSSERDTLILLSQKLPNLINASYTKNQAWKSDKDTLGFPPADEVPLEDHCLYRYLFNFRGVTASFRFKYLFLCRSLVLHVGDEWKEFFYDELKPWIHYIPVKRDASEEDYRKLMDFILNEDELMQEIAEEGYQFIRKHLRLKDILCYWKNLLLHYSKLLTFTPKLDKSLIRIY